MDSFPRDRLGMARALCVDAEQSKRSSRMLFAELGVKRRDAPAEGLGWRKQIRWSCGVCPKRSRKIKAQLSNSLMKLSTRSSIWATMNLPPPAFFSCALVVSIPGVVGRSMMVCGWAEVFSGRATRSSYATVKKRKRLASDCTQDRENGENESDNQQDWKLNPGRALRRARERKRKVGRAGAQ